jgi:predicted nicotinamide N-methyase
MSQTKVKGCRVIELGSGLGVPGIVSGLLGAEVVCLTEQEDPLVSGMVCEKKSLGTDCVELE